MRRNPMKVLDSFAWIEYLKGSERGATVKSYVDGGEPLYTPSICLTEVKARYLRDQKDPTPSLSFIVERSFIIPLSQEIALQAADENRGGHRRRAFQEPTRSGDDMRSSSLKKAAGD